MNELQVKTINLTPATVEFNYKELEAILDESLKKYDGLTFTEQDAAECKATITELNKGKKSLDVYRKETKKELTASVTAFENQCKELNKKFDAVINPLKEQHEQFEENRREEKRQKVQEIIAQLIEEYDLIEKYAVELIVIDSYLTKTKSLKSIKEELTSNAEYLKVKQVKEESDKQLIISTVELANSKHEVNLSESAYLRLLDFKEVEIIKTQILDDAKKEADKRAQEERRKQAIKVQEEIKQKNTEQEENPVTEIFVESEIDPFINNHNDYISDPFSTEPTSLTKNYEITATEVQLNKLQSYLNSIGVKWTVVE